MHSLIKASSYVALLLAHYAQAKPIAQGGAIATPQGDLPCEHDQYTITDQESVSGPKQQLAWSCDPTPDGCHLDKSLDYSVSVTVEVGASLDFDGIVGAGVSGSVSTSTTKGTTEGAEIDCGGPWWCGAIVTPKMVHVKGEKKTVVCSGSSDEGSTSPYEVTFPELSFDKLPVTNLAACACPNHPHSDDEGAPQKCLKDCA